MRGKVSIQLELLRTAARPIGARLRQGSVLALLAALLGGCPPSVTGEEICTPITCAEVEKTCGIIDDHCGGNILCGRCDAPSECDLNTNVCGCDPEPNPCEGMCGKLLDSCGQPVDCPACADGLNCGGGGPNVCGAAECSPATCADQGKDCGTLADGCGELITCGSCVDPQSCGGGGVANLCGCAPVSCGALGKDCGSISDACGGSLDCGTCQPDQTCGGGGVENVCGSPSAAGVAVLTWTPPTMNTDGSLIPKNGLGGYRVYYGLAPGVYGPPVDVGNKISHTVAGLASGATYYFVVTAYNTTGDESDYSGEVSKTFP